MALTKPQLPFQISHPLAIAKGELFPEGSSVVLGIPQRRISTLWLFLVGNLFFAYSALGQTNTWTGATSANWNTGTNWNLGHVPLAAEDVVIPTGITANISVNTAAVCKSFTMNGGANANTVTIGGGFSLGVTNAVTIGAGAAAGNNKILAVGTGSLSCGSITVTATTNANRNSGITILTGTATVTGSITMGDVNDVVTFTGAGTLFIGNTMSGGTLTPSTGTVNYNAAGAQTVGNYTYNNLTLSGSGAKSITTASVTVSAILSMEGTATASAAPTYGAAATLQYNTATPRTAGPEWITPFVATGGIIIKNTGAITTPGVVQIGNNSNVALNINLGATLTPGANLITLHGNFINAGTLTSGTGGVALGGGQAQSIDGFTTTGNLSMLKTAGIATLNGNINGGGLIINGVGTTNLGAGFTHTFTGNWTRTAGTLNGGSSTLKIGGSVSGVGGVFTASTGTVEWNAAGAQTLAAVTYNNLTLSGSGAKTTTGVTVNGILSMEGTATASVAPTYGAAATLQYNTATPRTAGAEWIATFVATGGIIIENTGAITTPGPRQIGNNTNVPLNINLGATLTPGANLLTLHGNFINAGTLTSGTGGVTLSGTTATQSIDGFATTGTVSMTKTAGTATFNGNVNGNALTINGAGGTLNLGTGLTHTFTGNWTMTNGTLNGGSSTLKIGGNGSSTGGTFTANSGAVEWNAGGGQTLTSVTYNNLILSGSGNKTFAAALTISGDLSINGTAKADLGAFTTHTANTLTLAATGEPSGTWGGTGSGANNINSTYFVASSGIITVGVSGCNCLPYSEPFTGETDGATSNSFPTWSVTQSPSGGTFSKGSLLADEFEVFTSSGAQEGVWQTADLTIGGTFTDVGISLDLLAGIFNSAASDYVNVYYVWDAAGSGSEVLIGSATTASVSPSIILSAAGHTKIRLVIRSKANSIIGFFAIDNINIIGIRTLYSRASTAWSTASTWSTLGINDNTAIFTGTPGPSDKYIIGGGDLVNLTSAATGASVIVNGTADPLGAGTLSLSTFGLTIGIGGPLTVNNSGGSITSAAGSSINFSDNLDHTITNNGAINVANVNVTNNSISNSMSITNSGTGILTVSNNVTITNNTFIGLGTITFTNNSTVTMTNAAAAALNDGGGGTVTWAQGTNSTLNYASSSISAVTLSASATGNTVNYNGAAQTLLNPSASTYYNLTLSGSGTKTSGGNHIITGGLSISGTASFNVNTNTDNISVGGDWTVTSTNADPFVQGGQTVTFNGTGTQTISTVLAAGETFNNLTLNKASGTLLLSTSPSTDVNISGTMTFTSGIMFTTTNESLVFASGAAVAGGNSTSYVDGPVKKFGNTAFIFPTGNGTHWARIGVGAIAGGSAATQFTAHYFATAFADQSVLAGLLRVSSQEYWTLPLTAGAFTNATVTLYWESGTTSGINSVTTANLRVARYNGTDWVDAGSGSVTGNTTAGTVTSAAITTANFGTNFTFGSNTALPTNPLPIELLSFSGDLKKSVVSLQWKTATEMNNNYFTVLHSSSGIDFESIGTVKGNGTTNETHQYALTDNKPSLGKNYYQLKQTDFDGHTTSSETIVVNVLSLDPLVSIYPNPLSQSQMLNVVVNGLEANSPTEIQIVNMQGTTVNGATLNTDSDGTLNTSIALTNLSSGLYILKVQNVHYKFVIQ